MERDYLSSLLNLFRKRISKIFVCLLIFVYSSCDFDSPSNFVVPTWFIDIKMTGFSGGNLTQWFDSKKNYKKTLNNILV